MDPKSVIKVGALTLVALGLFLALYLSLSHLNPNTYTVRVVFENTKGLQRQSVVRMRGVVVGEVKDIQLENFKPVATLAIPNHQNIPVGSRFRILSGILITNPQLEIEPSDSTEMLPKDNTAQVLGAETTSALAQLDPDLAVTVRELRQSLTKLDTRLDAITTNINDLLISSKGLVQNVNRTVTSTNRLVEDPRIRESLIGTLDNLKQVSLTARATANTLNKELTQIVKNSGGNVDKLTGRLLDILARIDTTLETANTVVNKLTEQVTDPRLQQSLQETLELGSATLARFNQIASDLHQITGDPQLQSDLKQAVSNLRAATESGKEAVEKVNDLVGNVTGTTEAARNLRVPRIQFVGNVSEQLNPSRMRVDAEARLNISNNLMLNLGFYDLGQSTTMILQGGSRPTDSLLFRYGLYASKLGAGLEWEPSPGTGLRADLYDTNRLRLDLRALYRVNNEASLWLGADNLFNRPMPLIGFQYRK